MAGSPIAVHACWTGAALCGGISAALQREVTLGDQLGRGVQEDVAAAVEAVNRGSLVEWPGDRQFDPGFREGAVRIVAETGKPQPPRPH
jgi:hypothetical protein